LAGRGERALTRPEGSYVTALLEQGPERRRKVGEEEWRRRSRAGESDERLVSELADLWFHSYVLLAARGLDPAPSSGSSEIGTSRHSRRRERRRTRGGDAPIRRDVRLLGAVLGKVIASRKATSCSKPRSGSGSRARRTRDR